MQIKAGLLRCCAHCGFVCVIFLGVFLGDFFLTDDDIKGVGFLAGEDIVGDGGDDFFCRDNSSVAFIDTDDFGGDCFFPDGIVIGFRMDTIFFLFL